MLQQCFEKCNKLGYSTTFFGEAAFLAGAAFGGEGSGEGSGEGEGSLASAFFAGAFLLAGAFLGAVFFGAVAFLVAVDFAAGFFDGICKTRRLRPRAYR